MSALDLLVIFVSPIAKINFLISSCVVFIGINSDLEVLSDRPVRF